MKGLYETPTKTSDWDSIYQDEDEIWLPNDSDRKKKKQKKNDHTGLKAATNKKVKAELKYRDVDQLIPKKKQGCCGGACSISMKSWRENIISNGNGERWLYIILTS